MSVPCPKCGAESDDIGSKYVCGVCYWVFDKGGGSGAPRAVIDVPTPQRPALTRDPKPPTPIISPSAAMPAVPAPGAPTPTAPTPAASTPAASTPAAPAPAASAPATSAPAASVQGSGPAVAAPTSCPKCAGNLVTIAGKYVCEKCFHTLDSPDAPADNKPAPGATPAVPQAAIRPQPTPNAAANSRAMLSPPTPAAPASPSTGTVGTGAVCPKCSGQLMDIGGKLVCGECYHVVDSPGAAPAAAKGPLMMGAAAAPVAPVIPTVCPKCSGKLMDVGGKYVCDECYHVVDTPSSSPSKARGNFTPRPVETVEDGQMTPQMIGGVALILLLILMIVVLAIRH